MAMFLYTAELNRIADHVFNQALTLSARTGSPGNSGNDNAISGNGYADIQLAASAFASAASGVVVANTDADFGAASGGSWGTVSHLLFKRGSANVGWVSLTTPVTINDGDPLVIPAAEIEFTVTPAS